MNSIRQIERMRKVHHLILQAKTGSPTALAERLHISERQLYNVLDRLKEIGAPVNFNRKTNTYYYNQHFDLIVNVSVQVLIEEELKTIYAGYAFFEKKIFTARILQ